MQSEATSVQLAQELLVWLLGLRVALWLLMQLIKKVLRENQSLSVKFLGKEFLVVAKVQHVGEPNAKLQRVAQPKKSDTQRTDNHTF